MVSRVLLVFFFSSRRRHTRCGRDWSSDVCSSDLRAWMIQLPPMNLYGALLFQVTGQQLSVAATRRTLARIEDLFGGHLPAPTELLAVDPGKLREAGLSWRKIGTLRDL